MTPEDKDAFVKWYNEQPTPKSDDWIPCKVPPHEIWGAALAHRDAQAQQVNQQMLEALKKIAEMNPYDDNLGHAVHIAEQTIAAAEAKGGV